MSTIALPAWVPLLVFGGVIAAALWQGGRVERLAATAMLLAWIATELLVDRRWVHPQIGVLAVDTCLLVFLVGLALRSDRFWPLWAAGFHLLAVVTHAARMLDPALGAWAYLTAGVIWAYMVIFALAFGTWGAWRERRQLTKAGLTAVPEPTRR